MDEADRDVVQVLAAARAVCVAALAEVWLQEPAPAAIPLRRAVQRLVDILGERDDRGGVPTIDDLQLWAGNGDGSVPTAVGTWLVDGSS